MPKTDHRRQAEDEDTGHSGGRVRVPLLLMDSMDPTQRAIAADAAKRSGRPLTAVESFAIADAAQHADAEARAATYAQIGADAMRATGRAVPGAILAEPEPEATRQAMKRDLSNRWREPLSAGRASPERPT